MKLDDGLGTKGKFDFEYVLFESNTMPRANDSGTVQYELPGAGYFPKNTMVMSCKPCSDWTRLSYGIILEYITRV